jgi:hypothetical protein
VIHIEQRRFYNSVHRSDSSRADLTDVQRAWPCDAAARRCAVAAGVSCHVTYVDRQHRRAAYFRRGARVADGFGPRGGVLLALRLLVDRTLGLTVAELHNDDDVCAAPAPPVRRHVRKAAQSRFAVIKKKRKRKKKKNQKAGANLSWAGLL